MNQQSLVRFINHVCAACIVASGLVSCATKEERAAQERAAQAQERAAQSQREADLIDKIKATCTSFGFRPNSDAFGQCAIKQQQIEAAKQAANAQFVMEQQYRQEQLNQQILDRALNRQPATPVLTCTTDWLNRTTCQ